MDWKYEVAPFFVTSLSVAYVQKKILDWRSKSSLRGLRRNSCHLCAPMRRRRSVNSLLTATMILLGAFSHHQLPDYTPFIPKQTHLGQVIDRNEVLPVTQYVCQPECGFLQVLQELHVPVRWVGVAHSEVSAPKRRVRRVESKLERWRSGAYRASSGRSGYAGVLGIVQH